MRREIFKIQVPIATNEPVPLAMIYNKDRSAQGQIPVNEEIKEKMSGRLKAFFWVEYPRTQGAHGEITIMEEADWQTW